MGPNLSATTIRPAPYSIPFPPLVRQNDPALSQRRALALGPLGEKCCVHVVPTLTVIAAECVPHLAKYPIPSAIQLLLLLLLLRFLRCLLLDEPNIHCS